MYSSDLTHPSPALEEKLRRLYTLNREKTIDLSFRPPYLDLLKKLGNPHKNLPPAIHVAGTNGKGSTIAFLRAILEEAGYNVHTYTSPHLVYFNERIVLNGKPVDNDMLERLIDEALKLNEDRPVTFFEITTAIAFTAFARTPADICLLEVGLGGRLDCTNVIENPLLTIITSISNDHSEHLGETLEKIAAEKAGIMKAQTPCIIGKQIDSFDKGKIIKVLENKALAKKSTLFRYGADWSIEPQNDHIKYISFKNQSSETYEYPRPALQGRHQIDNAGTAVAAAHKLHAMNIKIEDHHIAQGLQKTRWPARLQKLQWPGAPENWALWLDGGHNEDAGRILACFIKDLKTDKDVKIDIILGMMKHKDPQIFCKTFWPLTKSIRLVPIPDEPAALTSDELETKLTPLLKESSAVQIIQVNSFETALTNLKKTDQNKKQKKHVFIVGSLYLAGHVLRLFS